MSEAAEARIGVIQPFSLRRFKQPGTRFVQRQPDAETGPLPDPALQFNAPSVLANNALDDHQSQAGSLFFGSVKWLEDALELFGRDAPARIRDAQPNAIAAFLSLLRQG